MCEGNIIGISRIGQWSYFLSANSCPFALSVTERLCTDRCLENYAVSTLWSSIDRTPSPRRLAAGRRVLLFSAPKARAKQQHVQIVGLPRSSFSRYSDMLPSVMINHKTKLKRHTSFVTYPRIEIKIFICPFIPPRYTVILLLYKIIANTRLSTRNLIIPNPTPDRFLLFQTRNYLSRFLHG